MLLLACAAPLTDDAEVPAFFPPDEAGPWAAGTSEHVFVDSTGIELAVQAWYPTAEAGTPVVYEDVLPGTATEAAAPDCAAARPVMLFSHGSGGVRYQSIFWTEHLATHGWVVLAADHLWSTVFDLDEDRLLEVALRRPVEVRDTYDWLLETGADGTLGDCVDPADGYAVSGHSFGAYTSLVVGGSTLDLPASVAWCKENGSWLCDDAEAYVAAHPEVSTLDLTDPRAWAGVPMAPAGYELLFSGLPGVEAPFLVWGGELDELTPVDSQVRPIYEDLGGTPAYLAVLEGAGHYTFSDACTMLPVFDDCEPPYLAAEDAHPVLRSTSLAFLQVLRGEAEAEAWLPPADAALVWEARE